VSSPTIDRIKKEGVLFWAIGVSPPFGFELDSGVWAGVEAQNAAELATILGVDFDLAEYSYDVLPQAVVTGQADIVGAELFVTGERKKLIDFSTPYYQSGQLFYVLEGSPYQTIADLNNPGSASSTEPEPRSSIWRTSTSRRRRSATRHWATGFFFATSSPPAEPTRRCHRRPR
jgi:ABC-type amino acid transport substrate-binding protein